MSNSDSETSSPSRPPAGRKVSDTRRGAVPPARGMSLGWRLGLTTACIVTTVLGVLTLSGQMLELHRGQQDRDRLLRESLVSLASVLKTAGSLDEMRGMLSAFHKAYAARGYAKQQILLRDLRGRVIASAGAGPPRTGSAWTLRASLPISSPILTGGQGVLAVRQEASAFEKEAEQGWLFSLVDMAVTALCILLCLLVADYYLVARPLRHLLEGVRQMEMGYWGGLQVPKGADEIRWLAYRFQRLGGELEETMRRLVEAEKRALPGFPETLKATPRTAKAETGEEAPASVGQPHTAKGGPASNRPGPEEELLLQYLSDKCRLLESGDPFDPEMHASAEEAWERDVFVAERLGALHLKSRLEDASLRTLNPEGFVGLQHALATLVADRRGWLREQEEEIRQALAVRGVPFREIQHRIKNVGSIWRKVHAKGLRVEQLHDILAFRILVAEERDCYRVLEAIHHQFDPRLLCFKDYIVKPKPSGYQSIHTCVRSKEGFVFEVQIRTVEMHERAERGPAAHWRYKSDRSPDLSPGRGPVGGLRRLFVGLRKVLR